MSAVDFHTHVSDPLQYLCRLLRKVNAGGAWAQVHCSRAVLARLDTALWTFSPLEFLAHAVVGAPAAVLRRSPVVLVDRAEAVELPGLRDRTVLINLGSGFNPLAPWVTGFARVVELVASDEAALGEGRQRFRAYRSAGDVHTLQNFDLRRAGA
jgi:DNA polymerase III subunit chi